MTKRERQDLMDAAASIERSAVLLRRARYKLWAALNPEAAAQANADLGSAIAFDRQRVTTDLGALKKAAQSQHKFGPNISGFDIRPRRSITVDGKEIGGDRA